MKNINIGNFKVNVTAKTDNPYFKDSITETTAEFLNELSIVYGYAAELNKLQGYEAHAKDFQSKSDEIFNFLKKMGLYD